MLRHSFIPYLVAAFIAVAVAIAPNGARAQDGEMQLMDGHTWQQLSPDSKLAFVWGVAHVIEFERQLAKENWDDETVSFVPHLVKGLKGKSLNDVVVEIDTYYQGEPDRLDDPVMKTIVHTIVLPAL